VYSAAPAEAAMAEASRDVRFILRRLACTMLKNVETQDVLHLTGWEGIWGMIMTAISLLIFVEFECPFD
jgi:hypothetical protein